MQANDFIRWLTGFIDAVDELPTKEQWSKIKAELAEQSAQVYRDIDTKRQLQYMPPEQTKNLLLKHSRANTEEMPVKSYNTTDASYQPPDPVWRSTA